MSNNSISKNPSESMNFLDLPKEEIQRMLAYLNLNEISSISKTSKLLHQYCTPVLWRQFKQHTVLNPAKLELILKKYGKFIRLLTPNSLPGMFKYNLGEIHNLCPNIEEFFLNTFDLEFLGNYSNIINTWSNIKALTVFKEFEFELVNCNDDRLSKLKTLKLVNYYSGSTWIDELKVKGNISQLIYEFTNYNFNSSLEFRFNLFQNLNHLVLNLNFFSTIKFEFIDDLLAKVQNLNKLKFFEIYTESMDGPLTHSISFVPFAKITTGLCHLSEVILDLKGVLSPDVGGGSHIESDSEDGENVIIMSFQFAKLFPSICPSLTLLHLAFMDDYMLHSIMANCPNLKKLGTQSPLPILYEMPVTTLYKLTGLTITDIYRSTLHNQQYYRVAFPSLTTLYIQQSNESSLIDTQRYWNSIPYIFPNLKKLQINADISQISIETFKKSKYDELEELILKIDNINLIKHKLAILIENCKKLRFIRLILANESKPINISFDGNEFIGIRFYIGKLTKKYEFGLVNNKLIN